MSSLSPLREPILDLPDFLDRREDCKPTCPACDGEGGCPDMCRARGTEPPVQRLGCTCSEASAIHGLTPGGSKKNPRAPNRDRRLSLPCAS